MKLNIIEYNAEDLVDGFISCKREPTKTHLSEVKNDISQADLQYKTLGNTNSLKTIRSIELSENQKTSLIKCYEIKTAMINSIICKIRDENKFHNGYCPFCGYGGEPEEIDHYLPKSDFPEFSFIPINLIPICSKCNKKKSKYWIDNGERLYLHKYFDDDNIAEFLICKPRIIDEKSIIFEFCLDDEKLSEIPIGNIIKTHYEKLDILTMYKDKSNGIFSEIENTLVNFCGNIETLKQWIKNDYENSREKYGINFYKTVIFKSIYQNQEVLEWYFNNIPDKKKILE